MTPPPPKKKRKHNGTSLIFILIILLIGASLVYLIGSNLNLFHRGQQTEGEETVAGAPADTTDDKDDIINWLDAPVSAPVPTINRDSLAQERAKEEKLRREKEAAERAEKENNAPKDNVPVEVIVPTENTSAPTGTQKPATISKQPETKPVQQKPVGGEALFD